MACLEQHGVQPGQGFGFGRGGGGSAADQAAFAACRSLLPQRGYPGGPGVGGATGATGAAGSATFAQFQTCLKQHGVQLGAASGQDSAKTQAAIAACGKLLPNGGNGSTGTRTTA